MVGGMADRFDNYQDGAFQKGDSFVENSFISPRTLRKGQSFSGG
jgi:hypothetical protein